MNLDITSKYNYHEMCEELGIPYDSFLTFIKSGGTNTGTPPKETNVLDALNQYIMHLRKLNDIKSIAENTFKTYHNFLLRLKSYLETDHSQLSLTNLSESFFQDFLFLTKSDQIDKLSNATKNTYTAIIREFLEFCYYQDLTDKELKKKFSFKKIDLLPRYLEDEDVVAFLKEVLQTTHGYRYHAIFSFMAGSGCRVSEVSNLHVCDFDIANNVIKIFKGKGEKDRFIPIYPEVKQIVLDYLNLTGVSEWNRDIKGYLFSRDFGLVRNRKISVRSIERIVEVVSKKCNFDNHYTAHSFRHTFAVRCLLAGMRIEYLSQILGHTSIETTYIYIQLMPKELQSHITEKYPLALEKLLFTAFGMKE